MLLCYYVTFVINIAYEFFEKYLLNILFYLNCSLFCWLLSVMSAMESILFIRNRIYHILSFTLNHFINWWNVLMFIFCLIHYIAFFISGFCLKPKIINYNSSLLSFLDHLFNLKFAVKELERNSKKCEKEEKAEKLKTKKAIQKGNMEVNDLCLNFFLYLLF